MVNSLLFVFLASFFGTVFFIVWASSIYYRNEKNVLGLVTSLSMIPIAVSMLGLFQMLRPYMNAEWLVFGLYGGSTLVAFIQAIVAKRSVWLARTKESQSDKQGLSQE